MRGTVGQIVSTDDGADIVRGLLLEFRRRSPPPTAHAVRPDADAAALKILTDPSQPMTRASMYRDLRKGAPVEADHIVGDMVRRARTLGVDATTLRTAYTHLQVYAVRNAPRPEAEGGREPRLRPDCKKLFHPRGFLDPAGPNSMALPEPGQERTATRGPRPAPTLKGARP